MDWHCRRPSIFRWTHLAVLRRLSPREGMDNCGRAFARPSPYALCACFAHCVAGPVLLPVAGVGRIIGTSERLEGCFLTGSIVLGAANLIPSYRYRHRRLICLPIFLFGIILLGLRHRVKWNTVPVESIATGIGACLIVSGHVVNMRLSRRCQCCENAGTFTSAKARARSGPASCSQ